MLIMFLELFVLRVVGFVILVAVVIVVAVVGCCRCWRMFAISIVTNTGVASIDSVARVRADGVNNGVVVLASGGNAVRDRSREPELLAALKQ